MKRLLLALMLLFVLMFMVACGGLFHSHDYGEWMLTTTPTCTTIGEESRYCSCGTKEVRPVTTPGEHIYGEAGIVTPPTTTEQGYTTYTCLVCGNSYADSFTPAIGSSGLEFALNDDGESYSVTGIGACPDVNIVVPAVYDGKPVTTIGDWAFEGCSSLISIVILDSVTTIGNWAFHDCTSLTSVTFGENSQLTTIGSRAFFNCSRLTSIVIPSSVTTIDYDAFYYCSKLTSAYYGGTKEQWNAISIGSYNSDLTTATRYYYSETKPTTSGNYWHYVDGVPTKW